MTCQEHREIVQWLEEHYICKAGYHLTGDGVQYSVAFTNGFPLRVEILVPSEMMQCGSIGLVEYYLGSVLKHRILEQFIRKEGLIGDEDLHKV